MNNVSHLLTCSLLLLTCIQPAKAMEEDGPQRDWKKFALIGGGGALAISTLGAIIWAYRHQHHVPETQESSEILAIRAHLSQFETLSVQPDKKCPKFGIRLAQLNTALSFDPAAKDHDWLQKYPILTAATVTRGYFYRLVDLEEQGLSVFEVRKQAASLMDRFVRSQEIVAEARDTGNYYE